MTMMRFTAKQRVPRRPLPLLLRVVIKRHHLQLFRHRHKYRFPFNHHNRFTSLFTPYKLSADAKTRLETMTGPSDGFEIAEVDLKLRGPGDMMGTQQSGVLNLRIADIVKDTHILKIARSYARQTLEKDPSLMLPKNSTIKNTYGQIAKYRNIWNYIS